MVVVHVMQVALRIADEGDVGLWQECLLSVFQLSYCIPGRPMWTAGIHLFIVTKCSMPWWCGSSASQRDKIWCTLPPDNVLLHGMLHLATMNRSTHVDMCRPERQSLCWKTCNTSQSNIVLIIKSQGRMHYVNNSRENYYTVYGVHIPSRRQTDHQTHHQYLHGFWTLAIHREFNIFTMTYDKNRMSYNMDRRKTVSAAFSTRLSPTLS
jgi:hypothetical protein